MKQKFEIFNAYGERIYIAYVKDSSKGLAGAVLEAFNAPYEKLPAMNFSGCVMYLPLLEGADLSFCDFSEAELSGANLENAILRSVNFRKTKFIKNAFGYAGSIVGADLTDANLDGSVFDGVEYSDATIFPENFDVSSVGLIERN